MKAIINGKIILKDGIVEDAALLYTNVIEGIVSADAVPADAEVIDAQGGYVSPGLIDLHIHGYLGVTSATVRRRAYVPSPRGCWPMVSPAICPPR